MQKSENINSDYKKIKIYSHDENNSILTPLTPIVADSTRVE